MNRKELLVDFNNYLEKNGGREHLTFSLTKFLIWFFENSTKPETENYSYDEFADQIMLAMSFFRSSSVNEVAELRREFLNNSQLIKVTSIPDLSELSHDKQKDAFSAILRLVVCKSIHSAEFTYWPFIGFKIFAAQTQLDNAVVVFTAEVWENGLREMAIQNPDRIKYWEIIPNPFIRLTISKMEDNVVAVKTQGEEIDFQFEINEKFKLPKVKLGHVNLAIALRVINDITGFWIVSREKPEIFRIIVR